MKKQLANLLYKSKLIKAGHPVVKAEILATEKLNEAIKKLPTFKFGFIKYKDNTGSQFTLFAIATDKQDKSFGICFFNIVLAIKFR